MMGRWSPQKSVYHHHHYKEQQHHIHCHHHHNQAANEILWNMESGIICNARHCGIQKLSTTFSFVFRLVYPCFGILEVIIFTFPCLFAFAFRENLVRGCLASKGQLRWLWLLIHTLICTWIAFVNPYKIQNKKTSPKNVSVFGQSALM